MTVPADITLILPEPPSANRLFREVMVGKRARRVRTSDYNRWRERAARAVENQTPVDRIDGAYSIRITIPKQRQRDLGNNEKPISDLLQMAGVIQNDVHSTAIHIIRDLSREPGNVLVEIWAA